MVSYPAVNLEKKGDQVTEAELRGVRNLYGLPGEYILFLNTIEPRKNLAGLIRAFEALDTNTYLVVAGRPGWKNSKDFSLIRNSPKAEKIIYIGYVEEKLKPALIKMAKALIYPSFYEGFGFQALEAMAMGTPVVASQVTSLPEVVGKAGLLVNPYDTQSLARGLKEILSDETLRNQLIQSGYKRVEDFSWKKTAQKILEQLSKF